VTSFSMFSTPPYKNDKRLAHFLDLKCSIGTFVKFYAVNSWVSIQFYFAISFNRLDAESKWQFLSWVEQFASRIFRPVLDIRFCYFILCCLSLVLNFLDLDKALHVFLFVFDSTSHTQKMLSSMEGTFCHSNKKPFLLYVGMLAPKDVLQFSGTSYALEGLTVKLGAPGEHAFPRHTYYINLQVSSYLINNYWKSSKISSNPLLMSPTFQYFFSTSFWSLQNWQ